MTLEREREKKNSTHARNTHQLQEKIGGNDDHDIITVICYQLFLDVSNAKKSKHKYNHN